MYSSKYLNICRNFSSPLKGAEELHAKGKLDVLRAVYDSVLALKNEMSAFVYTNIYNQY